MRPSPILQIREERRTIMRDSFARRVSVSTHVLTRIAICGYNQVDNKIDLREAQTPLGGYPTRLAAFGPYPERGLAFNTKAGAMELSAHTRKKYIKLLAKRDGWVCHYCGTPLYNPELKTRYEQWNPDFGLPRPVIPEGHRMASLDHKIARANGGTNDLDNLVLACHQCNARKGARYSYEQFVECAL